MISITPRKHLRLVLFYAVLCLCLTQVSAYWSPLAPQETSGGSLNTTSTNPADRKNMTTQALYVEPYRVKVTLPWWTSLIGSVISFLVAFKAVTWDWERKVKYKYQGVEREEKVDEERNSANIQGELEYEIGNQNQNQKWNQTSEKRSWNLNSPAAILSAFGLLSTFIQNAALLITFLTHLTSHTLGLMTPLTGNAYILLFAGAATLWSARVINHRIPLAMAWINVCLALLNYVLLSLPVTGSSGLYEAWSPHCSFMVSGSTPTNGCLFLFEFENLVCASGSELEFGNVVGVNVYVDWIYAGLIAVLLVATMWRQYLFSRWRQNSFSAKRENQYDMAVYYSRWAIVASLALATWSYYTNAVTAIKPDAVQASVVVCPGASNSTVNSTMSNSDANCTCVLVSLPGEMSSIGEVLKEDGSTFGRLLFDII